jgi:serine/threonine-protein kinase
MAGGSSGQGGWAVAGLGPGSLIAGYRVEARIGSGGMAMVLRARDEALGRTVALKILAPALAEEAGFRERFVRESRAVAAVDHPHIIPVYAAGEANGVLYLAMRYVSGGDLRTVAQQEGPLRGDRAVTLLSPVASALDAAHRAGLVHRDVKPANILVDSGPDRPEHPYLSDFGLAKGSASSTGLTGTGQYLGTPDYSAPEQISGKPTGPGTDQYALGCVAYTILTGRLPFPRDESMAVLWAHMYDRPPRVTDQRPDLPPQVDQVLARALAKHPEERYMTCGEFIGALRAAFTVSARTVPREGLASFGASATAAATWQGRPSEVTQAPARSHHRVTSSPYDALRRGGTAPGRFRGKRVLFGTLAAGVIGITAYLLVPSAKPSANSPDSGSALPPSNVAPTASSLATASSSLTTGTAPTASALPSLQACAQQLGIYCHIQTRTDDPQPLTAAELFPLSVTAGKSSYSLASTKVETTCPQALIGAELIQAVQAGGCTQVLRASYVSGDSTTMGTIGVINLSTTDEAHSAGKVVGQTDFIAPLTASTGAARQMGNATGVVESEFKGHYLIVTWSEFVDGTTPSTAAEDERLEQFSNGLVAGAVNPALTQRMLAGAPVNAAG